MIKNERQTNERRMTVCSSRIKYLDTDWVPRHGAASRALQLLQLYPIIHLPVLCSPISLSLLLLDLHLALNHLKCFSLTNCATLSRGSNKINKTRTKKGKREGEKGWHVLSTYVNEAWQRLGKKNMKQPTGQQQNITRKETQYNLNAFCCLLLLSCCSGYTLTHTHKGRELCRVTKVLETCCTVGLMYWCTPVAPTSMSPQRAHLHSK